MNLESIGRNIRRFRLEQHLRQGDLAQRAGLTANYIGMIERGEKLPSLETFIDILNALDLSADLVLSDVLLQGHIVKASALLKKHGLPHIRFHELRHSCASLLLNNGFGLKDVQEWLGHSDIKMTANIYGHLDVGRKQSIADQLSGVLSPAK